MSTIRATLAKWAMPLIGLFLLLLGLTMVTSLSIPPLLLGLLAAS